MVHISEISTSYISEIKDHLTEGQEVTVKVLNFLDRPRPPERFPSAEARISASRESLSCLNRESMSSKESFPFSSVYFSQRGDHVYVLNRGSKAQPPGTKLIQADRHDLHDQIKGPFLSRAVKNKSLPIQIISGAV